MTRWIALATLMLATTAAQAGETYSFEIGGRTIRIDKPRDCDDVACVSISIPGVFESGPKRGKRTPIDRDDEFVDDADGSRSDKPIQGARKPATPPSPTTAGKPAPDPAGAAAAAASAAPVPGRAAESATAPTAAPSAAPAATDKVSAPVVAAVPPAALAQTQPSATALPETSSPLGVWWTEEKEGKIRIEPCGGNLCGYSVKSPNDNGQKILIDMKPVGDSKWKGRIHDPKSGSDYDSTIALKGADRLRVQGCAFGGMFCGSQTWTRLN